MPEIFSILFMLLGGATATLLLMLPSSRNRLIVLAVQYAAIAGLTIGQLVGFTSVIKLFAGVVVLLILGLTLRRRRWNSDILGEKIATPGAAFRLTSAFLVLVAIWGLSRTQWLSFLGISSIVQLGGQWLIVLGLLQVGLASTPLGLTLGLLTLLGGFETLYAALESSLAIIALIAGVNVGIGLLFAYVISVDDFRREFLEKDL